MANTIISPPPSDGQVTPPSEEIKPIPERQSSFSSSKSLKLTQRATKRASSCLSQEHNTNASSDGRHKRVWKACERCRLKKTKCDGESPCKRCKDDGVVCAVGSRKKTGYKQLPRGYAEVLESTQVSLIQTVLKLYTMVRDGDSWSLGEPELNDRGIPVIHDIASRLGCIRPSMDLPCTFPEDEEGFRALQRQLAEQEMPDPDVDMDRKVSEASFCSTNWPYRASSPESEHSQSLQLEKDYSQVLWDSQEQQQQQAQGVTSAPYDQTITQEFHFSQSFEPFVPATAAPASFRPRSTASPVNQPPLRISSHESSPMHRTISPFSPWGAASRASDELIGPCSHLDLTATYLRQGQQRHSFPQTMPSSMHSAIACCDSDIGLQHISEHSSRLGSGSLGLCINQSPNGMINEMLDQSMDMPGYLHDVGMSPRRHSRHYRASQIDGTIRPNMLSCNSGPIFDPPTRMDRLMFGDCQAQGCM